MTPVSKLKSAILTYLTKETFAGTANAVPARLALQNPFEQIPHCLPLDHRKRHSVYQQGPGSWMLVKSPVEIENS